MRTPLGIQLLRIRTNEWRELDSADVVSLASGSRHPRCQVPIEAIQSRSRSFKEAKSICGVAGASWAIRRPLIESRSL